MKLGVHRKNHEHDNASMTRLSPGSPPCFDRCPQNDVSSNKSPTAAGRVLKEIEPRRSGGISESMDTYAQAFRRDFLCADHSQISRKSSKFSSVKNKRTLPRIVVLRPNHGLIKHNSDTLRRRAFPYDGVRFSKPSSKEARRISREIIRYSPRFRQYAGDEKNSYDAPEMLNSLSRYYSFGAAIKRSRFPSSNHHDPAASLHHRTSNFDREYRSRKEILPSQVSKPRNMKKPLPCQQISAANFDTQTEANVNDLFEKQLMLSELGNNDEASACDQGDSCIQRQDTAVLTTTSSESSKDADRASPVSVLEDTFQDALLISESFEKVGAEKNEINYFYASKSESWESSYAVDVLIHSGLLELGFDMFRTKWYSPDRPLNPVLFDDLEKKYDNEITGPRSHRMLLFDRIDSAVLDIFQQHIDMCPWVRPKLGGLHYSICPKVLAGYVIGKLAKQESLNGQEQVRELDREMQWLDGEGEMDEVSDVIVRLLIFDMIRDLVNSFM